MCLLAGLSQKSPLSLQIWMESYFVYAYEILFYCPSGETLKGIVHPKKLILEDLHSLVSF